MQKAIYFSMLSLVLIGSCRQQATDTYTELEQNFEQVPDSVTMWAYWYWMNDFVSREGITADLEAMAAKGITRAFIGNIGDEQLMPSGDVRILSNEWWDLMRWAVVEGARTGVDIGVFNGPGWSQSGGPWVTPDKAMRYLTYSEAFVSGPGQQTIQLPAPAEHFQDVVTLAMPRPAGAGNVMTPAPEQVRIDPPVEDIYLAFDQQRESSFAFPHSGSDSYTVDVRVDEPFFANSIVFHPAEQEMLAECEILAKIAGEFNTIKKFELDRQNSRLVVGPVPFGPVAVSTPGTRSDHFRIVLTFKKDRRNEYKKGGFRDIEITQEAVLEYYIEKQLAKLHQVPVYDGTEYTWPDAPDLGSEAMAIPHREIIDLSDRINAEGTLEWAVPDGQWVIQRIGMTPTQVTNHPALPHATGLEIDKINQDAVQYHFDQYLGKLLQMVPDSARRAFKHVIIDSYETGSQNWTDGLEMVFRERYGYDPLPWLPVITGKVVNGVDASERFLWDLRRLLADLVAEQYVGGLKAAANNAGATLWLENYGHWGFPGESLMYGGYSDHIAGEFWNEGPLGLWECKIASSAAHIYGKKIVSAESFTTAGRHYQRAPRLFKRRGDWSYIEGINQVVLTLFIHQPFEDKLPGVNAWFGSEINRHNTWYGMMDPWIDYQRRCTYLLQQGHYVADVCYFIGENAPKSNGRQQPPLPEGYAFDFVNYDVIMHRMEVRDGRFVLPDGMSYKILVLSQERTMRPELLQKIEQLIKAGGIVLGTPPRRSPSMQDYPQCDSSVIKLATAMWGDVESDRRRRIDYGKGKIYQNHTLREVLDENSVRPDLLTDAGTQVVWTHRQLAGMDIYFVANQTPQQISFNIKSRVRGKQPEWWEAVHGTLRNLGQFEHGVEGIVVPVTLEAFESGFLVFRDAQSTGPQNGRNFPLYQEMQRIESSWDVVFVDPFGQSFSRQFEGLYDWRTSQDLQLRHFSGKAVYRTTFHVENTLAEDNLYLNLGDVRDVAELCVNGHEVGGLWTAPWRIDISGRLVEGTNNLEITVVNTWVNRLIGEAALPPGQRSTWLALDQFKADDPLQASGLLGPVTLEKIVK